MKKITGILLAAVMLVSVLSVSAFAVNAPLTAAEFFANRTVTENTADGTLVYAVDDTPFIPQFIGMGLTPYITGDGGAKVTDFGAEDNAFDIVAKFSTQTAWAGAQCQLFFNPEIVLPLNLNGSVAYSVIFDMPSSIPALPATPTPVSAYLSYLEGTAQHTSYTTINDGSTLYNQYKAGTATEEQWLNAYLDGQTNGIVVFSEAGTDVAAESAPTTEIFRWPFKYTDASNTNWYRTKIIGSYDAMANSVNSISPSVNGVIYIENEDYEGPAFDIVGAMKAEDEGALRFGSVYFADGGVHDNETIIKDAGVLLYPTALLDDTSLTLDTTGAITISANGYYAIDGTEYTYTGVLTGLAGYENLYITARSYVKYMDGADEVVVYSDPIARSLNWVGDSTELK